MAQSVHLRVPVSIRLLAALPAVLLLIWTGAQASLVAAAPAASTSVATISCGTVWHTIASPAIASDGSLAGVAAIPGTKQLWAVGGQSQSNTVSSGTLIERWNGTRWSVIPSPTVAGANTNLNAVTALSASNAWAVGTAYASPTTTTVILHWNGSKWALVPSPIVGTVSNELNGVAALGVNDVWAVGDQTSDPTNINVQQLVEHWNGHAWSVVAGASLGGFSTLAAVTHMPGTSQLLAVGAVDASVTAPYQTVIERWNGSAWMRVPSPNVGSTSNLLSAITVLSSSDAWSVGRYYGPSNGYDAVTPQTLTEHFDGNAWKVVASPNVINGSIRVENELLGVAAVSASEVFTVGTYWNPTEDYSFTLAERWNGSRWSLALPYPVYTPPPDYTLNGVTHVPGTSQIWAVGYEDSNGPSQPVIVARC